MAIDRSKGDERQARVDVMIEEFRSARQRRLVRIPGAREKAVEGDQRKTEYIRPPAADKAQ